jgi:hypothetical protein
MPALVGVRRRFQVRFREISPDRAHLVATLDPRHAGRFGAEDNRLMAAGDAQSVWFREMVERLRDRWRPDMHFDAIISLRDDLDATLQRIRSEENIGSPVFRCRDCGYVGPGATPHVSVRAMILSLARFRIACADEIHDVEKRWAAHRKQNDLDLYGKQTASPPVEDPRCSRG